MSDSTDPTGLDNEYAPAWKPEPGTTIVGKLICVDYRDGGYGEYPIMTLDCGDYPAAVHAFHTVLRAKLEEQRPLVGEAVFIHYKGETASKDGRSRYHDYDVKVPSRPVPDDQWKSSSAASASDIMTDGVEPDRHELQSVPNDDDIPF